MTRPLAEGATLDHLKEHYGVREWGTYRVPLAVRLLRKIEERDGCWYWTGTRDRNGYGAISASRQPRMLLVHRASYVLFVGEIPAGLEIDHLCRNRGCVRPSHLETVTRTENMRRSGPAQKTECAQGHPYTPDNIAKRGGGNTARDCKACRADSLRRRRARQRAAA